MTTDQTQTSSSSVRGILLALLAIPVGVALWVVLWNYGFMASLVAFGIAYAVIWLFQLGAKHSPSKHDAYWLIAIIIIGVLLSFTGGIISDGWYAWSEELGESAQFFSADFWSFVSANLASGELWGAYTTDIIIAVVFAVLGAGSLVKDLFKPPTEKAVEKA